MNLELDLWFSSAKILNLELNFEFSPGPRGSSSDLNFGLNLGPVQAGSGSNRGSEPNTGIMITKFTDARIDNRRHTWRIV